MTRTTQMLISLVCVVFVVFCGCDSYARREAASERVQQLVDCSIIHPNDTDSVNKLLELAKSNYSFEATAATVGIGEVGVAAKPIISEIAKLMDSPNRYVSREAARTLGKLGPLSAPALPELKRQVTDKKMERSTAIFAAEAIGKIGDPAVSYLPFLRQQLGTGSELMDEALKKSIENLEKFDVPSQ